MILSLLVGGVLVAYAVFRPARAPDVDPGAGPASDARMPPEATLDPAPMTRAPLPASTSGVAEVVAAKIHQKFLAANPEATGKTAVAGNVVDAAGRPVLSGFVIYRTLGAEWRYAKIQYDGTFEINDPRPGPFELIANQGNGPIDRHAPVATAGVGDTDVLLRAPHDGTLKVRLTMPLDSEQKGYAHLTREDGEVGLGTSASAYVEDGDLFEFTGLDPGVLHVLWICNRTQATYAYLRGVTARTEEWSVAPTATVSVAATLRSRDEWVHIGDASFLAIGVAISAATQGESVDLLRSPDLTMPGTVGDVTLPRSTYAIRLRQSATPPIELRFEADGFRFTDDKQTRHFTTEGTIKSGALIVTEWKETR